MSAETILLSDTHSAQPATNAAHRCREEAAPVPLSFQLGDAGRATPQAGPPGLDLRRRGLIRQQKDTEMANTHLADTNELSDSSINGTAAGPAAPLAEPINALGITTAFTSVVDKWKLRSLMGWRANPDALESWQRAELHLADQEFGDGWWVVPRSDADDARFAAATKRLHESLDLNRIEVSFDDWYTVIYTDVESGIDIEVDFEPDTDAGMAAQFDKAMEELKAEVAAEEDSIRFDESTDRFHETLDRDWTEFFLGYSYTAPYGDKFTFTYIDVESGADVDVKYDPTTCEGMSAQFAKAMADLTASAATKLRSARLAEVKAEADAARSYTLPADLLERLRNAPEIAAALRTPKPSDE
ncbi:hypothetical protein E3T54_13665 [Cryobacterium sp. Sr8]|uniref:hypothetical protein n=1 Tax=Cryobacterium sp. Sr8 TaxID=1259203 RepID=UPI00106A24AD|nr:hypothetical protein [Cryobacterium sp. Sr8]TFD74617.1 hypothetical protein E3T54_13665 [Cryobacterium sp. Sr8]